MDLSSSLIQAFTEHPLGLCGRHDPAKIVSGVEVLEQRLNILTFGAVLDANPLGEERWSALAAIHDHWLLDPSQVAYRSSQQVLAGMQEVQIYGPQYIARVWWQVCRGVQGRYKGSWRDLLNANHNDAHTLQDYLQNSKATFPVLSGPIISARWLDWIHRIGGVPLKDWETLSVSLPTSQRESARLFGIAANEVHPLLAGALNTWQTSCRKLSAESCGLADCPKRK